MKHRRIACATISLAISFGVLGAAGSASAMQYGGHAMRKYGPDPIQVAQGIQRAQYAEQVRALESGTATLAAPVTPATEDALKKQSEQWAAQVRLLDDGTAALIPLPKSAAAASRCIGVGSTPSTIGTRSRNHATPGPVSANRPSATRISIASSGKRMPLEAPGGRASRPRA